MKKVFIRENAYVNKELFIKNGHGIDSGHGYLKVEDQNFNKMIDFATGPDINWIMIISTNPNDLIHTCEIVPQPTVPHGSEPKDKCRVYLDQYLVCSGLMNK